MIDLYKTIADKSYEEINSNKNYKLILLLNDMTWWGDPNDMPDMNGRKEIFNFINSFAIKHNVKLSCKELLDPEYKEWIKFACYLINNLKEILMYEVKRTI